METENTSQITDPDAPPIEPNKQPNPAEPGPTDPHPIIDPLPGTPGPDPYPVTDPVPGEPKPFPTPPEPIPEYPPDVTY